MKEKIYRSAVRLFLPHLARSVRHDESSSLFGKDVPEYVAVEDRGSSRTVFSFAGAAMLFAGMPAFEFRKMLNAVAPDYNLVFFRDVSRLGYRTTPQGKPNGRAFYESEIRRILESLGSTYHVAIGASSGAAAAIHFGVLCGFDHIVAFNQPCPITAWSGAKGQLHNYLNLRKLVTRPGEYVENTLVSLASVWLEGQAKRLPGYRLWDPLEIYLKAEHHPRLTLFYGEKCRADALNAERLKGLPDVKLIPLPVGLHNCATYLKKRNELVAVVQRELREAEEGARAKAG